MKKLLIIKLIIFFLLALGITTFLYWPLYQKIPLSNQESNLDQQVNRLDLPLGDDINEILNNIISLPIDRHKLCLKNLNGFYFIHNDSSIATGSVPLIFHTADLNRNGYAKENELRLGAMAINLYYHDGPKDVVSRTYGMPTECIKLDTAKLKKYASSTIEYSYATLDRVEELDIEGIGKLSFLRQIASGYYIDTSKSTVYIKARELFFVATFILLLVIFGFFSLIGVLIKKSKSRNKNTNLE